MWQKLYEFGKQLLTLKSQVEKNTQDIKDLRQDLKVLTAAVQKLAYTVRLNSENDSHEREKLVLRLENALLKIERRFLLSGKNDQDQDQDS
jgi:hypothetical protein